MGALMEAEQQLRSHLESFRKKFYLNQIVRGSILLSLVLLSLGFVGITSEGIFGFNSFIRTVLFGLISCVFLFFLIRNIGIPALKLWKISRGLDEIQIAELVRKFFPHLEDKLLNLIELRSNGISEENQLALAAIRKRTAELAPISFSTGININLNFRFARYLLIPIFFFACLAIIDPKVLLLGGERLFHFGEEYLKPDPFSIHIIEPPAFLIAGDNFDLNVQTKGDELPSDLSLFIKTGKDGQFVSYPMEKIRSGEFSYSFSDVREDFTFYVGNEEVVIAPIDVHVLKRPFIQNFQVVIDYPSYTGLNNDTLPSNVGDIRALKGSQVHWLIDFSGQLKDGYWVGDEKLPIVFSKNKATFSRVIRGDESYYFSLLSAEKVQNIDTVHFRIDALEDRFPSIYLNSASEEFQVDYSLEMPVKFQISDDFGFSNLALFYRFIHSDELGKVDPKFVQIPLTYKSHQLLQDNSLILDLMKLGMNEGDVVEYFVRVWDNDIISGPKYSTSGIQTINYPSLSDKFEEVEKNQDQILDKMEEIEKKAEEVRKGIEKFEEKLLNQQKLSFEDKKELNNILNQQSELQKQAQELNKSFEKNQEKLNQNQLVSEKTIEKYEQLQQLLEKLADPELEKMMEKFQKEMEKLDPRQMEKMLEQMKFDEKEFEKSLERTMELMKQLEVQQKVEELLAKLQNLQTKQDILNEKLEELKGKDPEEMAQISEQQKKLEEELEKINQELSELGEKKKETSSPDPEKMEQMKQDGEQTKQEMNNAGQQMSSGNKNGASQSQKNASKQIQKMMDNLSSMQMQAQNKEDQENLESLRELLENLVSLSFKQEDLRDATAKVKSNDPQLFQKEREQKQLLDDMFMVKDSLDELAKKVFQISKFVTDESNKIIENMGSAQTYLDLKAISPAVQSQHSAMTSINNLANMLSDVMDQMQQAMKNQKPGMGSCNKPGGKNPNMQQISQMQQMLNSQMQQMMEGMQKGEGTDPKKLSEMAAQQELIRQQLKEAHEQMKKNGGKALGDLSQVMEDMKETEDELVHQNLSRETLMRQQRILNRLLDSFKAVREKEEHDNQRESNSGQEMGMKSPAELDKADLEMRIRQELLKSNQLEYSNDFLILIEKYFQLLEKGNDR